ncbi:MAG: hypothetical protein HN729_04080 [Candidatus Marinimicrobia bacterium]|jgi:microcin C transport system substrate-binding protein|nr:hypothetical protein [Candidatus Neomarinimicrobiota bacterium]MBT3633736.1 hypothetical protein [Candidatus Neomarinimicrobiota bacterium]MBT3682528.1 hypothetical protein [Candidatus Neomarinimicrobiota bacterium]MBT3759292.1 hypothetical protein [Candidatus Neomarinimicrobiota bacterium]MBT3894700.1 hypothetical protein [Candidatus Neomarinimicrobiota bacterium]
MLKQFARILFSTLMIALVINCGGGDKKEVKTTSQTSTTAEVSSSSSDIVSAKDGGKGFEAISEGLGFITYTPKPEDLQFFGDPRAIKGGTLTSITSRFPATLRTIGQNSNYVENSTIEGLCYEGMITTHPTTLEFIPSLATHWKISDDKMTFWFRLNPKARFSDGTEVTSKDVVATYDLRMDETILFPSSQLVYGKFDRPVAESKYIVSVKCQQLSWRNLLYFGSMSILPEHILRDLDGTDYLEEYQYKMMPGTGVYIIHEKDIVNQESFTLTRRDNYWDRDNPVNAYTSNFDKIKFSVVKDNRTIEFEKFKKGEQDFYVVAASREWIEDCEVDSLDEGATSWPYSIKKGWVKKRKIFSEKPAGTSGYAFNMRKWPFDDKRIRYAFSYLYDREKMNKEMYYNEYSMMHSMYSGSVYENPNNEKVLYNPEKAVALLKEAGYSNRNSDGWLVNDETGQILQFEISIMTGSAYMVTPVQQMMKDYGIDMQIKFVDGNTNWKNLMERNYTVYMQNWSGLVFPNPETSLKSSLADEAFNNNISGFKNDRVDELLDEYDQSFDQARRVEIIREVDGIYSDIHPAAWGIVRNYQRMIYWDKFGYPEYMVSRYGGDYRSIYTYWWIDPDKEARLEKAMANDETLPQGDVDVKFWPKYLNLNQ